MIFCGVGKKGKIKKEIVINKIEKGGLQMIDVESTVKALKCRWVQRLMNAENETWTSIVDCYFENFGGVEHIFTFNLDKKGLNCITKKLPIFYKGVLNSWYEITMDQNIVQCKPNEVGEQKIWGNRFITNNKSVLFFKEWIEAGFIYVSDLFRNGIFIHQKYLLEKLSNKKNWIVQYITIKKAIPLQWKKCMKLLNNNLHVNRKRKTIMKKNFQGKFVDAYDFESKDFYWSFISNRTSHSYAKMIWENRIGMCFNWNMIWTVKVKNMTVKKYAQFNVFLLYDKIPHKYNLWKWKKELSPDCEYCNHIENCQHFLYDCIFVRDYWKNVTRLINKIYNISVNLQWKNIIYGYCLEQKKLENVNLIIMIATFAAYKARVIKKIFEGCCFKN